MKGPTTTFLSGHLKKVCKMEHPDHGEHKARTLTKTYTHAEAKSNKSTNRNVPSNFFEFKVEKNAGSNDL